MVLESTGEKTFKMMLDLLKSLWTSSVITLDQMRRVSMSFRSILEIENQKSIYRLFKGQFYFKSSSTMMVIH